MEGLQIKSESKEDTFTLNSKKPSNNFLIQQEDDPIHIVEEEKNGNDSDSEEELLLPQNNEQEEQEHYKTPTPTPIPTPVQKMNFTKKKNPRQFQSKPLPKPKNINTFDDFMNPNKASMPAEQSESEYSEEEETASEYSEESVGGRSIKSDRTTGSQKRKDHFRIKELLLELRELENRGYKLETEYNLKSKISDIENEVRLGNRHFQYTYFQDWAESGVQYSMVGLEQGAKLLNKPWLNLDGLGNATLLKKNEISYCLRDIIKKWVGPDGDPFPPEVSLLLILITTIVTTAMTNAFSKVAVEKLNKPGGIMDQINQPGFMQNMMSMAQNIFGGGASTSGIVPSNVPTKSSIPETIPMSKQETMNGPQTNNDINDLFQRLTSNNNPQNITPPNNFDVGAIPAPISTRPDRQIPKDESDRFSELSSLTGFSDSSERSTNSSKRIFKRKTGKFKGKKSIDI